MSSDDFTVGVIENNYFDDQIVVSICQVCKNSRDMLYDISFQVESDCKIFDGYLPRLTSFRSRYCDTFVYACKQFELDKESYNTYLQSKKWKAFAKEQKIKAGLKCELCGSPFNLELHHLSYDNILFETELDVVCLCHNCHSKIHDKEVEDDDNR